MKLYILAVGNKMPHWIDAGFDAYAKRMPPEVNIKLINIKPERRGSGKSIEQILSVESMRIKAMIPARCHIITLDEQGRQWSTITLADKIKDWMKDGGDIAFIIGGADGLHQEIKQIGNETLALSSMTLPHGLVRIFLMEQLYRAVSINKRHPYHRE